VKEDPQKPTVFINWELVNKKEPWDPWTNRNKDFWIICDPCWWM